MKENFFRKAFAQDSKKRPYYIFFTALFCIMFFICYSSCFLAGRSLIWHTDGINQHFRAMVYYSNYLKEIIRHLAVDHKLIIPDWDFYIGEGSDIVNTLSYYSFGDPIALLSVLVPMRYMHFFFSFAIAARMYLSGITFSALCFGTGLKNRYGILAGSIGCCFCAWVMTGSLRHPFFVGPMIWFPLMILGMEKIIRKEKPFLFIIATAISAASNFYFFYMIVLLCVLYALIRLAFLFRRQVKAGIITLLKIGVMSVIGVCMAGIILLPVLMSFLQDSRMSPFQTFLWLYPLNYYSKLPALLLSAGTSQDSYWVCMGFSAPAILALFLLFLKKKKDTFLKVLVLVCAAIMLFPIGGRILNGMSYIINRWIWAFEILGFYILAAKWNELIDLPKKQWLILVISTAVLYGLCMICRYSRSKESFTALAMLFIALYILRESSSGMTVRGRQVMLVGLSLLQAFLISFWLISPDEGNHASEMMENRLIWNRWETNEAAVVKEMADDSEYIRYSGRGLSTNTSMFFDVSSTEFYWSMTNPYFNDFRAAMEIKNSIFQNFSAYDDRTAITALSAVQYYSVPYGDKAPLPYGYTFLDAKNADSTREERLRQLEKELGVNELSEAQSAKIKDKTRTRFSIYTNDFALPLGYCYDTCFPKETWDSFDAVQKQEAQLISAYVEDRPEEIEEAELDMPDYSVPYELECQGSEISQVGSSFVTTGSDTKVILTLSGQTPNAETYVEFTGLVYTAVPEYDLYFGDETVDPLGLYNEESWNKRSQRAQYNIRKEKRYWFSAKDAHITATTSAGNKNSFIYRHPDSPITSGRHDFIVNCGYIEEPVTSITINLQERGIYSFDSLKVYEIPMEGFEKKTAKLRENTLQNIALGTDTLTGDITLGKEKLLCLAVPYSKGWEAFIDGRKTKVYNVNVRYQGIVVPSGEHAIEFRYHMPYKKTGTVLSLLGLAVFIAMIGLDRRKKA